MRILHNIWNSLKAWLRPDDVITPSMHDTLNRVSVSLVRAGLTADECTEALRSFGSVLTRAQFMALTHPVHVKRLFPKSAFTQTGPGVVAGIRRALQDMQPWQRIVAHRKGWDRGMCSAFGEMV